MLMKFGFRYPLHRISQIRLSSLKTNRLSSVGLSESQLNTVLIEKFNEINSTPSCNVQKEILPLFDENLVSAYSFVNISTLMHRLSKIKYVVPPRQLIKLTRQLETNCKSRTLPMTISSLLSSLRLYSSHDPNVKKFITAIVSQIRMCGEHFCPLGVSIALHGISNFHSEHVEVRMLLKSLTPLFNNCQSPFTGRQMANSLYGLKNCSSVDEEVQEMLEVLFSYLQYCGDIDKMGIAQAFLGMRKLNSDLPIVRKFVLELTKHFSRLPPEDLTPQILSSTLFGLQTMDAESPEVRVLLSEVASALPLCSQPFESINIGNAMYGLQYMSSQHPEVKKLIVSLTAQLKKVAAHSSLDPQALSCMYFGLQNFRSEHPETLDLLDVCNQCLADHLRKPSFLAAIDAQTIGNCLYGLSGRDPSQPSVQTALSLLNSVLTPTVDKEHLPNVKVFDRLSASLSLASFRSFDLSSSPEIKSLLAGLASLMEREEGFMNTANISYALFGMQKMKTESEEVQKILVFLHHYLSRNPLNFRFNHSELHKGMYGLQRMSLFVPAPPATPPPSSTSSSSSSLQVFTPLRGILQRMTQNLESLALNPSAQEFYPEELADMCLGLMSLRAMPSQHSLSPPDLSELPPTPEVKQAWRALQSQIQKTLNAHKFTTNSLNKIGFSLSNSTALPGETFKDEILALLTSKSK